MSLHTYFHKLQQQPQKEKLTQNIVNASSEIQDKQATGIPCKLNL